MAEALKQTGGTLTTVDYDVDLLKEAKANIQKAGLGPYIKIH